MSNFVQNATLRTVKAGQAVDVRTSSPAFTTVAGVAGSLLKYVNGEMVAAAAGDTNVYCAFILPGEKATFEANSNINISQNGIFRTTFEGDLAVGDRLDIGTDHNVVKKATGAGFATVRKIVGDVAEYEMSVK